MPEGEADLLYGLVGSQIFLEGFGPLTVSQHDVIGDGCPCSAFRLDIGPVLCGQVEAHHQVTLWNIHTFLHDAGGDQQVGFMSPEFAENLREKEAGLVSIVWTHDGDAELMAGMCGGLHTLEQAPPADLKTPPEHYMG